MDNPVEKIRSLHRTGVKSAPLFTHHVPDMIERIEARPNIELLCRTEIVALTGTPEGRLERVRWRHASAGMETERPIRNVFLFIGADPATNWLRACGVGLDAKGFVQTGPASAATNGKIREPL